MRTVKLIAAALATVALAGIAGTGSAAADAVHVVAPGETLTSVAATDGLTIAQLAAANGISADAELTVGETLEIPPATAPASTAAPAGGDPSTASASAGPEPTDELVSPSEVGQIAAQNDVPPSLAEAIADQESGFDNDEVSPTGATGVMQIEPGTWRYVEDELGAGSLSPASAHDNVLAGVELLRALLAQTGGDPELTAAGYYQGLESVREHGLYGDTRRYVRSVTALRSRFGGP